MTQDAVSSTNTESFVENATLSSKETSLNIKDSVPDPNPAGPTPTEDIAGGIDGVAGFMSKDAPALSHPTPPPEVEEPLVSAEPSADVKMSNTESAPPPTVEPADVPAPTAEADSAQDTPPTTEPSLVRPREDDDDEAEAERATKRSRVDEDAPQEDSLVDSAAPAMEDEQMAVDEAAPQAESSATDAPAVRSETEQAAHNGGDSGGASEPVHSEPAPSEPVAKTDGVNPTSAPDAVAAPAPVSEPAQAAVAPEPVGAAAETDVKPSVEGDGAGEVAGSAGNATSSGPKYDTAPMTPLQREKLIEKMKNLKKTKHSAAFLRPVDPVALNIPSYPEIIKNPMDLSTMDHKLKTNQYHSVQDFVNDFELIVNNCRTFNTDNHPVTQAAFNMQAYFNRMMETIPSADAPAPVKKRPSPAVKTQPRREQRVQAPPPPPVQAPVAPEVRRESLATNRPNRTTKPTGPREIEYPKPKRKEHQLELRFCQHLLDELTSLKLQHVNSVFLTPVDPVALNIPHYRQIIKHPMDLSTMRQKLKLGEYGNAKEFRKDFDLMIDNCLLFNPQGNPVRDMGIGFRREFEAMWKEKDKWERKQSAARGGSASADEESDEDDDDEEPGDDDKSRQIKMLQEQLAQMQNMVAGIVGADGKAAKAPKKSKSKGGDKKKFGSVSSNVAKSKPAAQPASKPKKATKTKLVTYEEKQEISEAVNRMDESQVAGLTQIITENCAKYRDMEEMELEIDDLPNDVQALLLKYVRKLFGNPRSLITRDLIPDSPPDAGAAEDDEEYMGDRGGRNSGGGARRKKHKPMSKQQQTDQIQELNKKLNEYKGVATSGSESPNVGYAQGNAQAQSSGDEESEESEEE
jgi:bromodomain-containing factor 1